MLRNLGRVLLAIFAFFALLVVGVGIFVGYKAERFKNTFQQFAGVDAHTIISRIQTGWDQTPISENNWKNVLLLGADEVAGRPEGQDASNVLTDSMMIFSLNIQTGKLLQYSLPRDLWVDAYKTKINALYHYGYIRTPNDPALFVKQVIREITGVPVHNVVVLKLSTVAEIVDAVGGLDIEVQHTFEDKLFPRPGIDVTTIRDPSLLYETVQFTQGTEHMSGERALVYVRSRHSTDAIEGTDEGRIARQKQVIQALIARVLRIDVMTNPVTLGKLYTIYARDMDRSVSVEDGVATVRTLLESMSAQNQSQLRLMQQSLSIQENGKKGVLYHPSNLKPYDNQWVYIPVKPDFSGLKQEIQSFYEEK